MSDRGYQRARPPEQYSIIVADSTRIIRELFRGLPAEHIAVKACVKTGLELELALRDHRGVDAVFCDLNFTGEQRGLDQVADLRAKGVMPVVTALILMSEDSRKSTLLGGLDSLPDTILLKPFNIDTLHRKLNVVVPFRRELAPLLALESENQWAELLEQVRQTPRYQAYEKLEAKALIMLGRHKEGAMLAHQALKRRPNVAWAMEALAHAAYRLGEVDRSEHLLQRLLSVHPYCLGAFDLLAAINLDRGDSLLAQKTLQGALTLSVHSYARNKMLGHIAYYNNDFPTAKAAYQRAFMYTAADIRIQEEDLTNLLRVLLAQGEDNVALQVLTTHQHKMQTSDIVQLLTPVLSRASTGHWGAFQQATKKGLVAIGMRSAPAVELAALELALRATLTEEATTRASRLRSEVVFPQLAKAQQLLVDRLANLATRQNGLVTKPLT
ncbi:hypothetical protein [Comamonas thiooxydans]|uniref:hypothetical protein n=1 Tax=Comamonas thiooxydans TaxID=363952 RepID=UPI0015516D37|nr:hypothetical protein [Comamonas thiooxydans]